VATAALVYRFLLQKGTRRAWLGAAIYLVHPAVLYDSAIWGQVDSIYTAFVFAGFVAFIEKRFALFGALLACAALSKAQTVVVLPLAAVAMFTVGWRHTARATAAGVAVVACVLAPFAWGGVLESVKSAYTDAVGFYPNISANAYNLWWSLYGDAADSTRDTKPIWLHASPRQFGWAMWGLCIAYVLTVTVRRFRARRELDGTFVFFAASLSAYSFFVLNTEMHERYLFPLVPLGLPVAMAWPRFRGPYALATLLYFANLLGVLDWTSVDRAIFATFPALSVLIASLQTACFAVTIRRFSEYAREAPRMERTPLPVTTAAALESEPPPSMEPLTSSSVAQQSAAAR
jgi:Gpi18-like mannosyltransferase